MASEDTSDFSCWCGACGDFRSSDLWETVRHKIEERNCMISESPHRREKINQGSCLVAIPFDSYYKANGCLAQCEPVDDMTPLGLDPVVLVRLPVVRTQYGKAQRNTYRPVSLDHLIAQQNHPGTSEEEQVTLRAAMGSALGDMPSYRRQLGLDPHHPSVASWSKYVHGIDVDVQPDVKPPETYVCAHCLKAGDHVKDHCPKMRQEESDWVSVTKRKNPTGVPMNKIREARTEEERETAPFVKDGVFYVWRK